MPIITAILYGPGFFMSFEEADAFCEKFRVILKIIYNLYSILPGITIVAILGTIFVIILKKAKKAECHVWSNLLKVFCLNLIYAIPVSALTSFAGGLPEAANKSYLTNTHLKLVYIIVYVLNIFLAIFFGKRKAKKEEEIKSN